LNDFADGVFFVALEDARDRPTVAGMIAAALGVREKVDRDLEAGVKAFTAARDLLLVLDNFEQVLPATPLVAELLAGSPRLRILVTSRASLHLSAEREYEVPPLDVPDLARLPSATSLSQYEAVALFIDRAAAARSGFAVTNANAPAIAEICSRLDGLPLAIELAAARVKLLSPEAILDRLVRRLPVLAPGPIDVPQRQRTLRGAIDWSYELLEDPERRFFRRLAVFAGGWTIEACENVCNREGELGLDTLDGLTSLADKSLIHGADGKEDEPRFAMLQVVREFATDRLEADDDADALRRRHGEVVLDLAERAEPELIRGDLRRWQRRMRREEDNIRAALGWAVATDETDTGLRIAGSLWRFWQYWAEFREGRRWLETMLDAPSAAAPSRARAKGLSALASILYWQGDAQRATDLYDEALSFYRDHGSDREIGDALFDAAWAAVGRGDIASAISLSHQAIARYEGARDHAGVLRVTAFLRSGAYLMGGGGSKDEAIDALREAVEICRGERRLYDEADLLGSIAFVHFRAGDYQDALVAFRDGLRLWREAEYVGMFPLLKVAAALELKLGRPERAARMAAAAARAVEEMGGELPSAMIGDINPLEEVREVISSGEFARAVEEGRAMGFHEATAYALEAPAPSGEMIGAAAAGVYGTLMRKKRRS
jgi:predicted ATPase